MMSTHQMGEIRNRGSGWLLLFSLLIYGVLANADDRGVLLGATCRRTRWPKRGICVFGKWSFTGQMNSEILDVTFGNASDESIDNIIHFETVGTLDSDVPVRMWAPGTVIGGRLTVIGGQSEDGSIMYDDVVTVDLASKRVVKLIDETSLWGTANATMLHCVSGQGEASTYVFGGRTQNGKWNNLLYAVDPDTNSWNAKFLTFPTSINNDDIIAQSMVCNNIESSSVPCMQALIWTSSEFHVLDYCEGDENWSQSLYVSNATENTHALVPRATEGLISIHLTDNLCFINDGMGVGNSVLESSLVCYDPEAHVFNPIMVDTEISLQKAQVYISEFNEIIISPQGTELGTTVTIETEPRYQSPIGRASRGVRKTKITAMCPAGQYLNGNTCSKCPEGTYSTDGEGVRLSDCILCPLGTISVWVGVSDPSRCSECDAGSYQLFTWRDDQYNKDYNLQECRKCPVDNTGTGLKGMWRRDLACKKCPDSMRSAGGNNACESCPAGKRLVGNLGSRYCEDCPKGTYQPYSNQTTCISASLGYYVDQKGQTSPKEAEYGYYVDIVGASFPKPCAEGTYNNITKTGTSDLVCEPCGYDEYSEGGATKCTTCFPKRANSRRTGCEGCGTNYYINEQEPSGCLKCEKGEKWVKPTDTENAKCEPCKAGTYQTFASNGTQICVPCPINTWSDEVGAKSKDTCRFCPLGTVGESEGLSSESGCSKCPAGQYGVYKGNTMETQCVSCTDGKVSSAVGAISANTCQPCPPGTHANLFTGGTSCVQCKKNTYRFNWGARTSAECLKCPTCTQSDPGSTVCTPCAGKTTSVSGDSCGGTAMACPCGWYKKEGSSDCIPCPVNYYCTGSGSASPCPVGQYATGSAVECKSYSTDAWILDSRELHVCPEGKKVRENNCVDPEPTDPYVYLPGLSPQKCGPGQYTVDHIHCLLCSEGTYSPSGLGGSCTKCGIGQTSGVGGRECLPCPVGTQWIASTSLCQECPVDTYQPQEGQSSCISCPSGTYAPTLGSARCLPQEATP